MNSDAPKEEGTRLISLLLDKAISDKEFARLESLMASDPDLRATYIQMVDQEVELFCQSGAAPNPAPFLKRRTQLLLPVVAFCVAVLLVTIATVVTLNRPDHGPGVTQIPERPEVPPPASTTTWMADFEEGLPEGWTAEFTDKDLPPGSQGAAMTTTVDDGESELRSISPPGKSSVEKFTITQNSHLHLTMKLENKAWFDFFMLTRSPDGTDSHLYKFANSEMWATEGRWLRFTIPLSQFDRKDYARKEFIKGDAPREGEIAWQIFISSASTDLTLVLDDISVDEEGTGEFEIEALP